ncbi:hypothetical protein [Dongia sp.]|uniref:phage tail tube protein n=1 Tax=Dongia sp. TaxID=1977262 RepID=UPI0035AF36DE
MGRAVLSQKSRLFLGDLSSPPDYQHVKGLVSWNGPDGEASEIDTTDLEDVARAREPGLQDFGRISFEGNFLPDDPSQLDLALARRNQETRPFIFVWRSGYWARFNASVLAFTNSGGVDAKVDMSLTLAINGDFEGPFAKTPEIQALLDIVDAGS